MNEIYVMSATVAYVVLLLLISRVVGRYTDNNAFFRGSRKSPWFAVAFGMIGASISGISFVSVPGMVLAEDMTYLQTCFGFVVGYALVAYVLLPLYYRLNLVSIYQYLDWRFGTSAYRTGAAVFLISKAVASSFRLYVVALILQRFLFNKFLIPFELSVLLIVFLLWFYTKRSGIRSIVWTDCLNTFLLIAALICIIVQVLLQTHLSINEAWDVVTSSPHSNVFVWENGWSGSHFAKQFVGGIFIVVAMTGLDQDMMQKNLSCKSLEEAQKNMCCYSCAFLPVNALLLGLGVLLLYFASLKGIALPTSGDEILPMLCAEGHLGAATMVFFMVGIMAATLSSADSAMTSITTSVCVDVLHRPDKVHIRRWVHGMVAIVLWLLVCAFSWLKETSVLDAFYTMISYTYGPLMALFFFGLATRRNLRGMWVPWVCIASPFMCLGVEVVVRSCTNYQFGYEVLLLNSVLSFGALWFISIRNKEGGK
ncbi:MAG: sodium:solute symporter [Paraprevotella sp.]|nr:sodium:solute symporter [Paraprevotella sp.]